jgi:hypothetical protein
MADTFQGNLADSLTRASRFLMSTMRAPSPHPFRDRPMKGRLLVGLLLVAIALTITWILAVAINKLFDNVHVLLATVFLKLLSMFGGVCACTILSKWRSQSVDNGWQSYSNTLARSSAMSLIGASRP